MEQSIRQIKLVSVLCAASVVLAACGSSGSATTNSTAASKSSSPSSVATKSATSFTMAIFNDNLELGAKEQGRFNNVPGMKFQTISTAGGLLPLVKSGNLAGISGSSALPIAISLTSGIPIKIVYVEEFTPIQVLAAPGISSTASLRNVNASAVTGTANQYFLDQFLKSKGLAQSDVKYVNLAQEAEVSAYKSHEISLTTATEPYSSALVAAGAKVLANYKVLSYVFFGSQFVASHPNAVQLYVCDLAAEMHAFRTNPKAATQAIATEAGVSYAVTTANVPPGTVPSTSQLTSSLLGTASAPGSGVQQIAPFSSFLVQQGTITKPLTQQQVNAQVDRQFAQVVAAGKCPS